MTMSEPFVFAVLSLDRAIIWRHGVAPHTPPEKLHAEQDNPDYKKQHDRKESGRDRSSMEETFLAEIASYLKDAKQFYLVSSGNGKANAASHFLSYLERKEPAMASRILGNDVADVNKLTENELLELGRIRWEKFLSSNL
jgi:hypothetical protein